MNTDETPSIRILLVDDNKLGLTARRMILEDAGYGVVTATSGEEAWEIFQKTQFDVVVTDFRMGGMDGVQLIKLIRGSGSPARIVMLSGLAGTMGLNEETSGADEFLVKSNREVPELLRAVKSQLQVATQAGRKIPVEVILFSES